MKFKVEYTLAYTAIILLLLLVNNSHAIPAFTRANNVECSTCHTIFPELNEYGEAFLKNSYVYFGKGKKKVGENSKTATAVVELKPAAPVTDSAVKGDGNADLLSKLKAGMMVSADAPASAALPVSSGVETGEATSSPTAGGDAKSEGIALSGVPELLPISFTANIHSTFDRSKPSTQPNDYDLSTRSLKLNAGGNFKQKAGFFGTYTLYTENVGGIVNTAQVPSNTKSDIGELFIILRNAFETPVNLKIGRFQPKLGLWKSNNKLSTAHSYATYKYNVMGIGGSPFYTEQPQDAVEVNAVIANRLFLAGGIVNHKYQNTKDWYVHTSVKIGGADYLTNEPEIDLNKEESILDFLTLTIGGYGYVGTNGETNTVAWNTPRKNEYYRAGMDIDLLYKLYRLKMSGVFGNDNNADYTYSLPEIKSYVYTIEGQYAIMQNFIGSLRFEYQDNGSYVVRRFIPTFAYAPIENVKVVAEYKHEYGVSAGNTEIANKIGTLGVTFSF